MKKSANKNGFTLVEVLVAVMLVGLAVASLVGANLSFTKANVVGTEMSNAEFLAEQIRELTVVLPAIDPNSESVVVFGPEMGETLETYDDLDDFAGRTFSPPIDSERQTLSDMTGFSQNVVVENVSVNNYEQVVSNGTSDFYRVTVTVSFNSRQITSASWVRANIVTE